MGVLVQVRDVPEETHRLLKARAALRGVSLSEYLRTLLTQAADRPTSEEVLARIAARGAVRPEESAAEAVRRLREQGE